MANSFTASFEELWAKEQQMQFYKTNVGLKIADMSFNSLLRKGDTLNRPYRSTPYIQRYTRGTDITIQDLTDTNEQLSINQEFAQGFYVDDHDAIQNKYDAAVKYGQDVGVYLSNQVDADILGEVTNATSLVDDGTLGGTTGNGITLTTSNVLSVISAAKKKLARQNVPMERLFGVISPDFEEVLVQYGAGRDTNNGDATQSNGFFTDFYGFKLYRSNQLTNTAVLSLATQPTNADTVVINGVTFTFVSSIGTTAGNVLIGANVDATRVNLTALINNPSTTSANQVALSAANAAAFDNLVSAVDSPSGDTMTVTYKGVGVLTVSETLTDATDTWTSTKTIQHCMFGVTGSPVIVMQKDPKIVRKEEPKKMGANYLNSILYGVKTFTDNAKMLVDVKINASGF